MASGAYDLVMVVGAEKVKDTGYQGLNAFPVPNDGTGRTLTAAAMFSMIVPAYGHKYGVDDDTMRAVLSHIAVKNHYNGARNERAQFRKEISVEQVEKSPKMAGTLGVFDCAGVADGAAAAIVCRAEDAHRYTDKPVYVKALSFVAGNGSGLIDPSYDYTTFPEIAACAVDAYAAGRREGRPGRGRHGRGPRLLHAHRAGAHGGPPVLRAGHRLARRPRRRASTSTASCRSTPTAASRASATRSAPAGCA